MPLALSMAQAADVYMPTGQQMHGSAVFRGLHHSEWLFRCSSVPAGYETWSISPSADGWAQCEGRLWIDTQTWQLRDQSASLGGVHVDTIARCGSVLATEQTRSSVFRVTSDSDGNELLSFIDGVTAIDVSCTLLWRFGAHGRASRSMTSSTVLLPPIVGAFELVGDFVVAEGEMVTLQGLGTATELLIGGRQLRVDRGGKLTLVDLVLSAAVGGSAVAAAGEVALLRAMVAGCSGGINVVLRFVSGLVQTPLGAYGAAVMLMGSNAVCTASSAEIANNTVTGATANWGGAIGAIGGRLVLNGTQVRQCAAHSSGQTDWSTAWGGGIVAVFAEIEMVDSVFLENEAHHANVVQGGAVALFMSDATVYRTIFQGNSAHDSVGEPGEVFGGCWFLGFGSKLELFASLLRGNEARNGLTTAGGGMYTTQEVTVHITGSKFEANKATKGKLGSWGGALAVTKSEVTLYGEVSFVNNIVASPTFSQGGAIAALSFPAVLIADFSSAFTNNTVQENSPRGGALFVGTVTGGEIGGAPKQVRLTGAVFDSNMAKCTSTDASSGGAVHIDNGEALLVECVLRANTALMVGMGHGATGGGLSVGAHGRATLINSHLTENRAGGEGLYERSCDACAQSNAEERAAHLANSGVLILNGCSLSIEQDVVGGARGS